MRSLAFASLHDPLRYCSVFTVFGSAMDERSLLTLRPMAAYRVPGSCRHLQADSRLMAASPLCRCITVQQGTLETVP